MDLETQIEITRVQFYGDIQFYKPTREQIIKLIILFKEAGILDREMRIEMIRQWTGLTTLQSSNDLTRHIASRMIDHLCDEDGDLTFDGIDFLNDLSFRA